MIYTKVSIRNKCLQNFKKFSLFMQSNALLRFSLYCCTYGIRNSYTSVFSKAALFNRNVSVNWRTGGLIRASDVEKWFPYYIKKLDRFAIVSVEPVIRKMTKLFLLLPPFCGPIFRSPS